MKISNKISVSVVTGLIIFGFAGHNATQAATAPALGATGTYGIVSSTYTNSANTASETTINGDVCYTTGPATAPIAINGTTVSSGCTNGVAQSSALATLNGQACTFLGASVVLSGTYTPGCYWSSGSMDTVASTTVTLSGNGVYVFRSGGALTTGANSVIALANGASASDVFWAPAAAATLGANSVSTTTPTFVGTIIADELGSTGITVGHFANVLGRLLAFGHTVTTDSNTITVPAASATLHVIKQVVNTGGGTATSSGFTVHVKSGISDVSGSPQAGTSTPGTLYALNAGTYTVDEDTNASYTKTFSGVCNATSSVTLTAGQDATCTITNTYIAPTQATLHVVTQIVNTGGGTATSSDFTIHVKSGGVDVSTSTAGVSTPGTLYALNAGTYTVDEDTNASYTKTFSGVCNATSSVTLTAGQDATCTITNTYIAPTQATLHVIKLVIIERGGVAVSASFNVHVKNSIGVDVSGSPLAGASVPGTPYTLAAGTYTVSEDAPMTGYMQSFSGACDQNGNVTLTGGDNKTCTIINTDILLPSIGSGGIRNISAPLIGIIKIPSPLSITTTADLVTYDYTVWNVGGQQAMTDIKLVDDKCSPATLLSGDLNNNGKLDPKEYWRYRCTMTIATTTTNTTIVTGVGDDSFRATAIATAVATVVVDRRATIKPLVAPLINVVVVPSRLTPFPQEGGDVIYSYAVTNPGAVAMSGVMVTDDKCSPLSGPFGDKNNNNLLDPGETWAYACQGRVSVSTRNIATAEGKANGFTALGYAFANVLVSTPGFPDAGSEQGSATTSKGITRSRAIAGLRRSLSIGATGADVTMLQTALEEKGLFVMPKGVAKGYFGNLTRRAVEKYQESVGLPIVGIFGPRTKAKIIFELGE